MEISDTRRRDKSGSLFHHGAAPAALSIRTFLLLTLRCCEAASSISRSRRNRLTPLPPHPHRGLHHSSLLQRRLHPSLDVSLPFNVSAWFGLPHHLVSLLSSLETLHSLLPGEGRGWGGVILLSRHVSNVSTAPTATVSTSFLFDPPLPARVRLEEGPLEPET